LDTALVSAIEGAQSDETVVDVLTKDLGVPRDVIEDEDVQLVRWACRVVAVRAATLAACAIAAVVQHTDARRNAGGSKKTVDVGLDGR
jgi:hexokinase